jgi:hypothetical protein
MSDVVGLPWRIDGLAGFSTSQGPTFDGGWFTGGGPVESRTLTVRVLTPMGRPATVELDLTERDRHGCTATLDPATARQAAAALVAAADQAEREMAKWAAVVAKLRADVAASHLDDAARRAGERP